ncbi:Calmodulin-binding receptor-like cytoplasmic kinase 3 [Acorus calamus]|uniref:non-specific serine/threonine protein kinase n=1 Tax=Acorus calamus TaxID=4465 RepID=A0AAV9CQV2_ACOCL|nr:Calmodulin-binding receptor-like cytoplasmic kinase 3 [Acorus calamus]
MTSPFLLFSLLLLFSPNRLSLSVRTPLGLVFEDCPIIVSHPEFLRAIPHPDSLCDVLGLDFENGCFFSCDSELRVPARRLIGREISGDEGRRPVSVELHRMMGRRFLSELTANASVGDEGDEKLDRTFPVLPVNMAVSIPGMLLLCCFVICPCFRAKAREEEENHAVLPNGSSSKHSTSSFEVSKTSERTPASPHWFPTTPNRFFKSSERHPGSPHRGAPPSPSYVAPSQSRFSMSQQLNKVDPIHLNVNQVIKATHNFSPSLKIGGGGFGVVYKAELPDGQIVAIKRAKKENIAALRTEFSNEIELLAKIEHLNLVKLLGYIEKGNERIIITEYVRNGTLRDHLDGLHGVLDFNQRLQIAIDVAHALTYLHLYAEKPIIHRDVKSSNILLTESMRAKVADFGFARTGSTDIDQTHISTEVKGTAGYLDPEYLKTLQLTPKSDVFSFGILLIEIISGRRPVELRRPNDERIAVRWAFKTFNNGNVRDILDPRLEEAVDTKVLSRLLDLAFQCAAPTLSDRPVMQEVGARLWEIRKEYGFSLRRE